MRPAHLNRIHPAGSQSRRTGRWVILWMGLVGRLALMAGDDPSPTVLPIHRPAVGVTVSFAREILPVLQANCLPCHNKTTTKADLLLESPTDMLKGGESGPALVIGKPAESLLFRVSTHEVKPRMPPKENKVNAHALTPVELGLLAVWIEQGAQASRAADEPIAWQLLPAEVQNIASATVTADGRWAACGRGNHLAVYDLGRGEGMSEPIDESLRAAHRDVVNAVAFSPDGTWMASGGFREVKLWRRTPVPALARVPGPLAATVIPGSTVLTNLLHHRRIAFGGVDEARLTSTESTNALARLTVDGRAELALSLAQRELSLARSELTVLESQLEVARKDLPKAVERRMKAEEALRAASRTRSEKQALADAAGAMVAAAELDVLRAERSGSTNRLQKAGQHLEKSRQALGGPTNELKQAVNRLGSAEEEARLADLGWNRATMSASSAERSVQLGRVRVQDADERLARRRAEAREAESPVTAAWIHEAVLGTRHADGSLRTWHLVTGRALDFFPLSRETPIDGPAGSTNVPLPAFHPQWILMQTLGGETNSLFVDRINALAFRPDGQRLAIGGGEPSRGGDVHVVDPFSGAMKYAFTNLHSDSVLALAWSPDGRWLVSGGADRFARMMDTASARPDRVFEGHTGHVLAVAWSPDGRTLATGGAESALKLWDTQTGDKRKQFQGGGKEFTGVAFLSEEWVVGASGDPLVSVWKRSGEHVRNYEVSTDFLQTLAVTPDGQTLVAGGLDGTLRVWQGIQPKPVWSFASKPVGTALTQSAANQAAVDQAK